MGPELFDPEIPGHRPTKHSDCYALGMVIYEVLSGHVPFYQLPNRVVSGKILMGGHPERPQGTEGKWFTDEIWGILGSCWMTRPESRPTIEDVLQCLEKVRKSWKPPASRSFAVLPTANPPTQELSDIVSVEIVDARCASRSSQQPEKLEREESVGVINQVSYPPRINGCIIDVDATMLGSGRSPTPANSPYFTWLVRFSFITTRLSA